MKQILTISLLILAQVAWATTTSRILLNSDSTKKLATYHDTIHADFIISFNYPADLKMADVIDNCRSLGKTVKNYDKNQGIDSTNTRQWSICMQDTADYSIEYLIKSWKLMFKGNVTEHRDSIIVDHTNALQVILKDNKNKFLYRRLIYFKKYSTLFEIMNIIENTNSDFGRFYKSLSIKKLK